MKIRILSFLLALIITAGASSSCAFSADGGHMESDTSETTAAIADSAPSESDGAESETVPQGTEAETEAETVPITDGETDETEQNEPEATETEPKETKPKETEPRETVPPETEPKETLPPELEYPEPEEGSFEALLAEVDLPDVLASKLTLPETNNAIDAKARIRACEKVLRANKAEDAEKLKNYLIVAYKSFKTLYMQYRTAYLVYSTDVASKEAEQVYYDIYNLYLEVDDLFLAMLRYRNDSECVHAGMLDDFYKTLYEDVIYSKPGTKPSSNWAAMSEIKRKFLSYNSKGTAEQIIGLYTEFLAQSRSYAQAFGYDNYYEYVSDRVYDRNYGAKERERLREYVREYLIPLYIEWGAASDRSWGSLTLSEREASEALGNARFDSHTEDYLLSYFRSLPASLGEKMQSAIERDRIVFGESENALLSAYEVRVGDTPMCYFHEDMADLVTVSHEIGHYYNDLVNGTGACSQDLIEVHSQSNTLLMLSFMSRAFDSAAVSDFVGFEVNDTIHRAIASTIRDEFEEIVFSDPNSDKYTVSDMRRVMQGLIEKYRVKEFSSEMADQLLLYWHSISLDSPGYRISYVASSVVSLQIYQKSLTDYDGALESYRRTVENIDRDNTFLGTLENAGLLSPFDEACFKKIRDLKIF